MLKSAGGCKNCGRQSLGRSSDFRGSRLLSLLAVGADAKDAVAMMKRFESVATNYLILQLLDLFVIELDQRAASGADQMVMMGVLVVVLV